jgi:hypothetical protein
VAEAGVTDQAGAHVTIVNPTETQHVQAAPDSGFSAAPLSAGLQNSSYGYTREQQLTSDYHASSTRSTTRY